MLSIEYCKKVLNKNGKRFEEKDVIKLRELLYQFAELDYKNFKSKNSNEKDCYIHKSVN